MPERGAVRASYDALADAYTERFANELAQKPFDRAWLDAFAARVRGQGVVADVGCGPGHVAAYLRERDVDALGIDLSPEMIARAQVLHPQVRFEVGDVTALAASDGAWAGAAAMYSLINLPRDEVVVALREIRRALRPGAPLLLAFHVGEEVLHLDALWDIPVHLAFVFFTPEEMRGYLDAAGFVVEGREERDPYPDVEAQTRRCYVLARADEAAATD